MPLIGGLAMLLLFWLAYDPIDPYLYAVRDDGVITMSQGRGWVDQGTISLSASGERVEAYSSPLQMMIYAAAYALFELTPAEYTTWQTYVAAFFLGWLAMRLFAEFGWRGFGGVVLMGWILGHSYTFLAWHGSGMENALIHVFVLGVLVLCHRMYRAGVVHWASALVICAAAYTRIEGIWYVGPAVGAFALAWTWRYQRTDAIKLGLLALILWGAVFSLRAWYFGNWLPNTAVAQNIDVMHRLESLWDLKPGMLRGSAKLARKMFSRYDVWPALVVTMPLLYFQRRGRGVTLTMLGVLGAIAYLTPFVFGKARLDLARTTSYLAVVVAAGTAWVVLNARSRWHAGWAVPLLFLAQTVASEVNRDRPHYKCCATDWFNKNRKTATDLAEINDIFRPTFANPDLGIVSWHKTFNILDLGYLGSPVMSRMRGKHTLLADYFFDFAAPDIIENHDAWSCRRHWIFSDPRFEKRYEAIESKRSKWLKSKCRKHKEARRGVWIRKDVTLNSDARERRLIEDLRANPDPRRLLSELDHCTQLESRDACLYVTRTAYRFLPELEATGRLDEIKEAFQASPTRVYDLAILNSRDDGDWHEGVIRGVKSYSSRQDTKSQ